MRHTAQTAAYLVDSVIPHVPVRQWVLSFPIPLRSLFAVHPELLAPVLQIVHRIITTFLIQQAGLKRKDAATGAVTLIQRFVEVIKKEHLKRRVFTVEFKAEAMKFSPEARADLADWLWISATSREEVKAAWDAEIARRVAAMDAGEVEFVSAEEVMAKLDAKLRSHKM